MAAGRVMMFQRARIACQTIVTRQHYRGMAAIPETLRMETKEKKEYERKLMCWRKEMAVLRKKFFDHHQRYMQTQLSSQEDTKEEEKRQDVVTERIIQERNKKISKRREIREKQIRQKAAVSREVGAAKQQASEEKILNKYTQAVSNQMVESENFITEDNIDAKLREIITNTKDYNFYVYEDGKIVTPSDSTEVE
ncbi:hypothetical protein TrispH2_005154 [Trichoplax sp. H2]|nr:hypothetical protein TrispH2_005154 [Trichoplax sp. H2]|eukprot:RDD41944.1 hypothetical protein TrispH2_005154 [Trichoplax sp. H2]